jgi:hypothetical protein
MQARGRVDAGSRRLVFGGRGRPLAAARRSPLEIVEKVLTGNLTLSSHPGEDGNYVVQIGAVCEADR